MPPRSYGSTRVAFYQLASDGDPPNPWETAPHARGEAQTPQTPPVSLLYENRLWQVRMWYFHHAPLSGASGEGPPSSQPPPARGTGTYPAGGGGAGTSWDPSHGGTGETKDDYFSPLRDYRHGAELGCFMSFCEQDQIRSGCGTAL